MKRHGNTQRHAADPSHQAFTQGIFNLVRRWFQFVNPLQYAVGIQQEHGTIATQVAIIAGVLVVLVAPLAMQDKSTVEVAEKDGVVRQGMC